MALPKSPVKYPTTTIVEEATVDEITPLLGAAQGPRHPVASYNDSSDVEAEVLSANGDEEVNRTSRSMFAILSVLLLGVFVSQADTSLVLATYGQISSEFDDLQDASWLLSSYMLAMCVAQPLYGKLSDIFGRKTMLQISYTLFAVGSAFSGFGKSMGQVVAARAIQGVGGAGMVCLVSILITDLVPLRDVAAYRSYVNIVQTVGRSCGGAIGGALAQTVGWRWAFIGQTPLTVVAMLLVAWKLECKNSSHDTTQDTWAKLKRIDFLGAALMSSAVLSCLLVFDMGGDKVSWDSPLLIILAVVSLSCGVLFCFAEKYWATEPIFPLRLLTQYEVVTSYLILALQNASQTALMLCIPLYFQVTQNATPAAAGAYMIPAIIGNTSGGLLTGAYIKRYGRYKLPIILSSISACICFTLLLATWSGHTPVWQSLFVYPGGLATGIAHSAVFVALGAGVGEQDMAIAGSGLYLSGNIGAVTGLSACSALFQSALRSDLGKALEGVKNGRKVARQSLSNVEYVQGLSGRLRDLVVGAYVSSFRKTFALSLGFVSVALLIGLVTKERRLGR